MSYTWKSCNRFTYCKRGLIHKGVFNVSERRLITYIKDIADIREYLHKECGAPLIEPEVLRTLLFATHRFIVMEQSRNLVRKKLKYQNYVLTNYGENLPPIRKAMIFHIGLNMIKYAEKQEKSN